MNMIINGDYEIETMYVGDETVVKAYLGDEEVWSIDPGIVNYITFTAMKDGCEFYLSRLSSHQTIEYKTKGNRWRNLQEGHTIRLSNSGDCVYIRGMLSDDNDENNYTAFHQSQTGGGIKISGNINYLWNKDNPNAPLKAYCGCFLFNNVNSISDISELEFPSEELSESCYSFMFFGCNSLKNAPQILPATTLANSCYKNMFSSCKSLLNAPALPATALTQSCYSFMFSECNSLTNAPALPATILSEGCYYRMFEGCNSLTNAPALPATALTQSCYSTMFWGCTSIVNAPELPATILIERCYYRMFEGCSNLNYIKCLATDISANHCTSDWVKNVQSNSGTFVCPNSMRSVWNTKGNSDGKPDGWNYQDS